MLSLISLLLFPTHRRPPRIAYEPVAYEQADNDPPRNRDIPSEAQHYGDVADNAHDIKKAERALHDELSESRFAAGHPTGGTGSAPGGPAPSRSS